MAQNKNDKFKITIQIFVLLFFIGMYIYLLFNLKDFLYIGIINYVIILSGALMAGIAAYYIPGSINYNNEVVKASGGFAVFIVVISGGIYIYNHEIESFNFTVHLLDQYHQTAIKGGKLIIRFKNSTREVIIDQYGSAHFGDIPSEFKNKYADAELIDVPNWQFNNGNRSTKIKLDNKDTTLVVEISKDLCCLQGTIVDNKGIFIEGAEVWVKSLKPVYTSPKGHFMIELPNNLRTIEIFELFVQKGQKSHSFFIKRNRLMEPTIIFSVK